ncbi:amino acid ABC transporter permease [bacterium RCC_150]
MVTKEKEQLGPASDLVARLRAGYEPKRIREKRHPGRVIAAAVVVIIAFFIVQLLIGAEGIGWPVVFRYLFAERVLAGLVTTLWLTATVMAIAIAIGITVAIMERSTNPVLRYVAQFYVWVFRATPTLVQLLLWFNLSLILPRFELGIPFTSVQFWSVDTNQMMTPILAAILGLALSEGAYMAEIMRSGLESVSRGQHEAAWALGMNPRKTFFKVTLPQAIRTVIPPTGNQVIGMLKYTSLASVISVSDLLFSVEQISSVNFQVIPLLVVASIWYLILASSLQLVQDRIERHYNRGVAGAKTLKRKTDAPKMELPAFIVPKGLVK